MEKRTHTTQDVEDLKEWFENHSAEIPKTMQIDTSAFSPNLRETINMLLEQAYVSCENPKMQGSIRILQKIKTRIEEKQS